MRFSELMSCLLFLVLLVAGSASRGADCNGNGVDDLEDLKPRDFGFVTTPTIHLPGLSYSCSKIIPADLDGDLDLDLIGARCSVNFNDPIADSSILMNQGAGGFTAGGSFAYPGDMVAEDFDVDGRKDLASARFGVLTIYFSQDGPWLEQEGVVYPGDFVPLLGASDLNGDSYVDLVTMVRTNGNSVSVFLNQGNGNFEPNGKLVDTGLTWLPRFLATADLDGDQDPDLLVSREKRALPDGGLHVVDVLLFFNDGEGRFERRGEFNPGECAASIAAADLDEDGRVDLAVAHSSIDGSLSLHLNTAEGTFKAPVIYPVGISPVAILAADLDRDGHLDLAVALGKPCFSVGPSGNLVSVLLGHGDGTFNAPLAYFVGSSSVSLAAADFDKDGFHDIAVGNHDGVAILLNQAAAPVSLDLNRNGIPDECERPLFHRGDSNSSGTVDISDGIAVFAFLFLGDPPALTCKDSADSNDDGALDLSDGIYLLNHLFLGGPPPPAPGPPPAPCGVDPGPPSSPGSLGCLTYRSCE